MKKYDAFLFDADNTLYDYDKSEWCALEAAFTAFGLHFTENIQEIFREVRAQLWGECEAGRAAKGAFEVQRFARLFAALGVVCDAAAFNAKFVSELGNGAHLIAGALELCRAISQKGKRAYIVTNSTLQAQTARMAHSPIRDFISDYFVSEQVGFQKPDVRYFEYVFARISPVEKNSILMVGDYLPSDIQGGINASIDTCWFNIWRQENKTGIIPTYEVKRLGEIMQFV